MSIKIYTFMSFIYIIIYMIQLIGPLKVRVGTFPLIYIVTCIHRGGGTYQCISRITHHLIKDNASCYRTNNNHVNDLPWGPGHALHQENPLRQYTDRSCSRPVCRLQWHLTNAPKQWIKVMKELLCLRMLWTDRPLLLPSQTHLQAPQ